jgi:hypothetical protein
MTFCVGSLTSIITNVKSFVKRPRFWPVIYYTTRTPASQRRATPSKKTFADGPQLCYLLNLLIALHAVLA